MKSLSFKIALGYIILIILNITIALFSIVHIRQLSQPIDTLLKEKYKNVIAADKMLKNLELRETTIFNYIEGTEDSINTSIFKRTTNNFLNWHQQAVLNISLPQEPVILDSISLIFPTYLERYDSLQIKISQNEKYSRVKMYHLFKVTPLALKISSLCNQLREVNEIAIRRAGEKANKLSSRAYWLIIVFALIAVGLSILAAYYFTRIVVRPIKETTETVRKIGQGNFNQKLDIQSDDEMAELGYEFNRMTDRLQEYEKLNIQEVLQEKKKSEAVVAHVPVGLVAINSRNKLVLINEQGRKILGIRDEKWQDRNIKDLISEPAFLELLDDSEQNLKTLKITTNEIDTFYLVRQFQLNPQNAGFSGIIFLLQDVTQFKELDKLKTDFIATISHEIRTPLTSLNMGTDLLLGQSSGALNEQQKELLKDIKSDVQRIQSFIRELLDLSKLEAGKLQLNLKEIQVPGLIKKAVEQLVKLFKDKEIKPEINIEFASLVLEADETQLLRVMVNLLKNAIEHTGIRGKIKIQAIQENENLILSVMDNGAGIPAGLQPIIFDKFVYQQDVKDKQSGNFGLGLSIVREIVTAHQGSVWVESEEGKGSSFLVKLPIKQPVYKNEETE